MKAKELDRHLFPKREVVKAYEDVGQVMNSAVTRQQLTKALENVKKRREDSRVRVR